MSFRPSRHYGQAPKLKPSLLSDTEPLFKGAKNSSRFTPKFPAVNRPMKTALKPKPTISVSGIFNRVPMKEVYPPRPARMRRPRTPEHELFVDYKLEMDASRQSMTDAADEAFNRVNIELNASLNKIQLQDVAILNEIEGIRDNILTPLASNNVETEFTKANGEKYSKLLNIGELYLKLKRTAEQKEAELVKLWAEWDSVQQEIIDLGVEVLGVKAVEDVIGKGSVKNAPDSIYAKEMRSLILDYKKQVAEVEEEVEAAGVVATDAMEASEHNFETEVRKFQARMIQQLLNEELE